MTRILAVLNQKGGVGKTTTCVNLGAALARRGFKVLLLDMDPQANLTVHLGGDLRDVRRSTYSLLLSEHALGPAVRQTATPGLRYVPSTLALANAEIQLASAVGRELLLREAIEGWLEEESTGEESPRVHFIIIDCPPSLGILTMNALCAANEVVLPIQTEFFALQGVAGILESLKAVQRLNRGLRLSMVVPCMWDRRTTLARDVVEEVEKYFGKLVSKTRVRNNVKLAEAPSHGMTIFEYDASSNGAKDYTLLAKEVLGEPLDEPEAKPVRTKSAPRTAKSGDDEPVDETDAAGEDAEATRTPTGSVHPTKETIVEDAAVAVADSAAPSDTLSHKPSDTLSSAPPADNAPAAQPAGTAAETPHTQAPTPQGVPTLPPSALASTPAEQHECRDDFTSCAVADAVGGADQAVESDTETAVADSETSAQDAAAPRADAGSAASPSEFDHREPTACGAVSASTEVSATDTRDAKVPATSTTSAIAESAPDPSPDALAAQIDAAFAAASADSTPDDYRHGL